MSGRRGRSRRQAESPPPPAPQPESPNSRFNRIETDVRQGFEQMAALFTQHFGVNASGTTPTPPSGPPIPPAPPVTQPNDRSKVRLKEFLKMNPPAFRGKKDPT